MPKKQKAEAGAPAWMVTFADLMSLLVCFFVLIISFSIQDTVKLQVVAGSMREAFGVTKERKFAGIIELDGHPERKSAKNVRLVEDPVTVERDYAQEDDGSQSGSQQKGARGLSASAIEQARFFRAKAEIENALQADPFLEEISEQVTIQMSEEGLSVVLVDQQGRSMFQQGSPTPNERGRRLIEAIASSIREIPNPIRIEGHSDASAAGVGGGYGKFELTAERANAARRILEASGLESERIAEIVGKGDSDPLFPDDPYQAGNRRVVITLMRSEPVLPEDFSLQ